MNETLQIEVDHIAAMAQNAAFVALAIAGVHGEEGGSIPLLVEDWVKTEATLGSLNVKDCNYGLSEAEDADRKRIEAYFSKRLANALAKKGSAKGLKIEYAGEPRGPAIRVFWDGCPSNGFGGGLIIPLP